MNWDFLIVFLAVYLLYVVIVAVALFPVATLFAKFRAYRKNNFELFILTFVSAVAARFIFTEFIRLFYDRPRPFEVVEDLRQLIFHTAGGSFPSGHAAFSFAIATAVSLYYPKTSIFFFVATVLIGFGRVEAGVHWISDIFGGALVGIATALAFHLIWKTARNKMTA